MLPRTAPLSSCTVLPELTGILRSFVKAMLLPRAETCPTRVQRDCPAREDMLSSLLEAPGTQAPQQRAWSLRKVGVEG